MALRLPEADRTMLLHSPLQLVVCQLRFDETLKINDPRVVLALHEAVGGRKGPYPKSEPIQVQRTQIQVGAGGPERTHDLPPQSGRRLKSTDDQWTISLLPTYVSLETTAYTTWEEDFRGRFSTLVDAVAEHACPAIEERVGLRYINQLTEPPAESPSDWHDYVAPELLGLVLHPNIGPAVTTTLNQVALELNGNLGCLLRHGAFLDPNRPGKISYMLDFDAYRQEPQPFDPAAIKQVADQLNDTVLRLFQQSVTPQLLKMLREG